MTERKTLILAVDDEPDTLRLIKRVLEPAGYEVITTSDSNQALALVTQKNPQAVLLDIKMPVKSGMEVLEELRTDHPDVAVIMATGVGDMNTAIKAIRNGAFDYLTKPFHMDEIVLSVERALEKRKLMLDNREYQHTIERQLTALNELFQSHLRLREEVEEVYSRLASEVARLAQEMHSVAKEAEAQKKRMQMPPVERQVDNPGTNAEA